MSESIEFKLIGTARKFLFVMMFFLALLKFATFRSSDNVKFFVFCAWAATTFFLLNWMGTPDYLRFRQYLEKNHKKDWEFFTSDFMSGPGNYGGYRFHKFVYSREPHTDPVVMAFKENHRAFRKLTLILFISFPFLFLLFCAI